MPDAMLPLDRSLMPQQPSAGRFLPLKQKRGMNLKADADDRAAKLRKAAGEFEAVFLSQMLKQMRNTIHKEEMFHGGAGEDIFTEMLDEEFSRRMAGQGSLGIADLIYRQLSRQLGIEEDTGALPGNSGRADALLQKMQSAERKVRTPDPQPPPSAF